MAPSVKSSNKNSALCLDPKFDAILIIDDDTYIFKGMQKKRNNKIKVLNKKFIFLLYR